jgi:hypothetical protein
MDSIRDRLSDGIGSDDDRNGDASEDETGGELLPAIVGQDERRMQVRAYNYWASMLDNRNFPSVDQLDPDNLPEFGPFSVLLDFTAAIDNPSIRFLGAELAAECGAAGPIVQLSDVPRRSLLSRITDHYMQILANQAPIGFEAEFVNQHGRTIFYRGILLPFAAADDRIDYIYGVINWKELADQMTTDEMLLEIDQVIEPRSEPVRDEAPLTEWADGPVDNPSILEIDQALDPSLALDEGRVDWPEPAFGSPLRSKPAKAPWPNLSEKLAAEEVDDAEDMGLADWLASARELAEAARGSEDRSRHALYAAVGRAYDFSLAAAAAPDEFRELIEDAGLIAQERAPLTPLVKLVFGADYDKTRLAEYAAVLGYAHRRDLGCGALAGYLAAAPGGLKGVVTGERRLRRIGGGKAILPREAPRKMIQRKLRKIEHHPLGEVSSEGSEFTLLLARRLDSGEVVLLGEIGDDVPMLERAAKKLID